MAAMMPAIPATPRISAPIVGAAPLEVLVEPVWLALAVSVDVLVVVEWSPVLNCQYEGDSPGKETYLVEV